MSSITLLKHFGHMKQKEVDAHDDTINKFKYVYIPELEALEHRFMVGVCVCVSRAREEGKEGEGLWVQYKRAHISLRHV